MQSPDTVPAPETVVLVHGIWMSSLELLLLALFLVLAGRSTAWWQRVTRRQPKKVV